MSVWTLLFTVVVPTPPRRAVLAALVRERGSRHRRVGVSGPSPASTSGLCFPTCSSWSWRTWEPESSMPSAPRSAAPVSWEATGWRSVWGRGAWAKSGGPGIACWPAPRRSSSSAHAHDDARRDIGRDAAPVRARGAGHRQPALAAHRQSLRLRRRGGRRVLLRHGAARRTRRRDAGAPLRAAPAERAIHLASPGLPFPSEAESRGLVHRDIKPANIFLCRYGEELRLREGAGLRPGEGAP